MGRNIMFADTPEKVAEWKTTHPHFLGWCRRGLILRAIDQGQDRACTAVQAMWIRQFICWRRMKANASASDYSRSQMCPVKGVKLQSIIPFLNEYIRRYGRQPYYAGI